MPAFPLASLEPQLRALAAGFVPETAGASNRDWNALSAGIHQALADRPAALQRQLRILIRLIDLTARLRHGRGIARLDPAKRTALLERLATSRLLLLRRGIWGLRTLVMLGWYGRPEVQQALGYRASAAGWSARQ